MSDKNQKKPNDSKWKKVLYALIPIIFSTSYSTYINNNSKQSRK